MRASGSVVEHLLAKEGVAGSIPVSRFYFFKRYPMDTSFVILFPRRVSNPRGFDVSPAGSVVASASQRCPPDTSNPSRAFIFLEVSNGYLFCYFVPRRVSNPCGFDVSPTGSVVASATQRCPQDTSNPSRFLGNDK